MAGLTLAQPLWLLSIPVAIAWALVALQPRRATIPLPTFEALTAVSPPDRAAHRVVAMRAAALCLIALALAGPQLAGRWIVDRKFGLDIMLALDISGSMAAQDLLPDRIEAAKQVLGDFIVHNSDERLGLVVFKAHAMTLCPLTTDSSVVASALSQVSLGTLSDDGTAIGDAIGTCLNRLADVPRASGKSQLIVLLTDGENNSGMLSPLEAAAIARSRGVKIDTIAVGKPGGAPVPLGRDPLGNEQYVRNPDGSLYLTTIDEATLRQISRTTGGLSFRAGDTGGLAADYRQIAQMTRHEIDVHRHRRTEDLAGWPLVLALGLLLGETWLANGRRRPLNAIELDSRAGEVP